MGKAFINGVEQSADYVNGFVAGETEAHKVAQDSLRVLLGNHLAGIDRHAQELRELLAKLTYKTERSRAALRDGESLDNLFSLFACDLDTVASKLARKCERYEALVDHA